MRSRARITMASAGCRSTTRRVGSTTIPGTPSRLANAVAGGLEGGDIEGQGPAVAGAAAHRAVGGARPDGVEAGHLMAGGARVPGVGEMEVAQAAHRARDEKGAAVEAHAEEKPEPAPRGHRNPPALQPSQMWWPTQNPRAMIVSTG